MTKKANKEIGRRIHNLRISAGLSVEELAMTLAITPKFLKLIERGECNATLSAVIGVSRTFSVSLDYIVFDKSADMS